MAISFSNFDNLVNSALDFYVKEDPLIQNIQEKPLLAALKDKQKAFPGGQGYISLPVQGAVAADQAGFFAGYSHTDQVGFVHPDNILRAKYPWREVHAGIVLDYTELKQRGVSIVDGKLPSAPTSQEIQIVKDYVKAVLTNDFGESWARSMNNMCWKNGTQDAKQMPGLLAVIDDDPTTGTVGGLDRATYAWWRHRALVGSNAITPSASNSTLIQTLNSEMVQLMRYGGRPDIAFAGSDFLAALRTELFGKAQFSVTGLSKKDETNIGVADVPLNNLVFKYDPTLDSLGLAKRAFILDSRHVSLQPMEGQDMIVQKPVRPYDQYVLLKAVTWTGALTFDQLNCHGVYEVK